VLLGSFRKLVYVELLVAYFKTLPLLLEYLRETTYSFKSDFQALNLPVDSGNNSLSVSFSLLAFITAFFCQINCNSADVRHRYCVQTLWLSLFYCIFWKN